MKYSTALLITLGLALSLQINAAEQASEQETDANNQTSASPASAKPKKIQDTVLGMNVSGNKELPNVLYIIPWKSNATPAALPRVTRLVDEIYAPVDPEVFQKQVKFYYQLTTPETQESEKE
ncbi:MAG: hypothetical protein OQK51_26445 [Kangiellaceae bacterium]|nr:hypothetical protein [Kangiellaceae bacterium]